MLYNTWDPDIVLNTSCYLHWNNCAMFRTAILTCLSVLCCEETAWPRQLLQKKAFNWGLLGFRGLGHHHGRKQAGMSASIVAGILTSWFAGSTQKETEHGLLKPQSPPSVTHSSKVTPPNPKTVPLIGDQPFKHKSLWEPSHSNNLLTVHWDVS